MTVEILTPNDTVIGLLSTLIKNRKSFITLPTDYPKHSLEHFLKIKKPIDNVQSSVNTPGVMFAPFDSEELQSCMKVLNASSCTNAFVYAPKSIMSWHTNSNLKGYRTYYTYTLGTAVFRYVDPITGAVENSFDNAGWTVRRFKIDEENLLWHTIWTEKMRFAFGFNELA